VTGSVHVEGRSVIGGVDVFGGLHSADGNLRLSKAQRNCASAARK
jgi:hypothetical protein